MKVKFQTKEKRS